MSQPHVIENPATGERLRRHLRSSQRVVLGSLVGIAHITGDARRVREARAVTTNGKAAE